MMRGQMGFAGYGYDGGSGGDQGWGSMLRYGPQFNGPDPTQPDTQPDPSQSGPTDPGFYNRVAPAQFPQSDNSQAATGGPLQSGDPYASMMTRMRSMQGGGYGMPRWGGGGGYGGGYGGGNPYGLLMRGMNRGGYGGGGYPGFRMQRGDGQQQYPQRSGSVAR